MEVRRGCKVKGNAGLRSYRVSDHDSMRWRERESFNERHCEQPFKIRYIALDQTQCQSIRMFEGSTFEKEI